MSYSGSKPSAVNSSTRLSGRAWSAGTSVGNVVFILFSWRVASRAPISRMPSLRPVKLINKSLSKSEWPMMISRASCSEMLQVIHCYGKRIAKNGFRFFKGNSVFLKVGNRLHCIPNEVHVIARPVAEGTCGCTGAAPGRAGRSGKPAAGTTWSQVGRLPG